jgi:hypothetical protein
VLSGKTVVSVKAGGSHALALCSDGTLAAWGLNSDGQLGDNTTLDSSTPVLVTQSGVLAGKTVVAISAGQSLSFAMSSDGTVAAWGTGDLGQLGNGGTSSSSVPVLITQSGVVAPTMQILQDFAGSITWTWSYVSPGLYTLQSSQPIFLANKTALYVIPDVSAGKPYCAAIERSTDTLLLVNCFDPTNAVSGNNYFTNATLKIEIYP